MRSLLAAAYFLAAAVGLLAITRAAKNRHGDHNGIRYVTVPFALAFLALSVINLVNAASG